MGSLDMDDASLAKEGTEIDVNTQDMTTNKAAAD